MNYRSITDLNNTIINNLHLIPPNINLIVGIPRSGLIPALLIALYRNVPYCDVATFINGNLINAGERLKDFDLEKINNVLVVDDSLWTGNSLMKAKESLSKANNKYKFTYAAIYVKPGSENLVDISFETLDDPRIFQWNLFHHSFLNNACIDIDGVLCIDPINEENDDGRKYENFISDAKPLYIPTVEVNTIVSCRLEKYRNLTEKWLKSYGILYKKLILLDLPDKESRMKWNKYGEFKANIYKESGCLLFIESSLTQAKIIFNLTNKAVFCTENFEMMKPQIPIKKREWNFLFKFIKLLRCNFRVKKII